MGGILRRFRRGPRWGVNLFAVVALAAIGALFVTGRRPAVLGGLVALVVLSLADWVLIEDFGFFGGVGTDPNSMLPMALLSLRATWPPPGSRSGRRPGCRVDAAALDRKPRAADRAGTGRVVGPGDAATSSARPLPSLPSPSCLSAPRRWPRLR